MTDTNKRQGFADALRSGVRHVARALVDDVVPSLADGAGRVMDTIDARILRIERRVFKRLASLIAMGVAGVFLLLALSFFLTDSLTWNRAAAFFTIGAGVLVTGLVLLLREADR